MGLERYGINPNDLPELFRKSEEPVIIAEAMFVPAFEQLLNEDPDKAIGEINSVYHKSVEAAYEDCEVKQYLGWVGGPNPHIIISILNSVGRKYPSFTDEQKMSALERFLCILDDTRSDVTNGSNLSFIGYTPNIREPLLLSDISISQPGYWPRERANAERKWIKRKFTSYDKLSKDLLLGDGTFDKKKIASDFLTALGILRNDRLADDYILAVDPQFLDRCVQGISELEFHFIDPADKSNIEKRRKKLHALFPKELYERIEDFSNKRYWVNRIPERQLGEYSKNSEFIE